MKQMKWFFIIALMFLSNFNVLSGQACNILRTLTDDLASPALENFFNGTPDGVKFYSILAKNGEPALASLRADPNSLNILKHISTRFSFNGVQGAEGLAKMFEQFPAEKYAEILDIIKRIDDKYDGGDAWKMDLTITPQGEISVDFRKSSTKPRDTGNFNPREDDSYSLDTEWAFEQKLLELSNKYIDPSKPAIKVIIGEDNAVACAIKYTSLPGLLDIHSHGGTIEGKFYFQGLDEYRDVLVSYTVDQMIEFITDLKKEVNFNAVRILSCHGEQAGHDLAKALSMPVITGSNGVMRVNTSTGNLSLPHGTLTLWE